MSATKVVEIFHQVREQLVKGELPAGAQLRDTDLAVQYGVSRNTAREVLSNMRVAGLVQHQANKGFFVAKLSQKDVEDIYQVREILELQAIERLPEASPDLRQKLFDAFKEADESSHEKDWMSYMAGSLNVHRQLVATLGSPLFDDFFSNIVAKLRIAFAEARVPDDFQQPWAERDKQIYELIAAGERFTARALLKTYLDEAKIDVLEIIQSRGRE